MLVIKYENVDSDNYQYELNFFINNPLGKKFKIYAFKLF